MLVKIENVVINTRNITLITEDNDHAVLYFIEGYRKSVTLSVSLNEFVKQLNSVGVTIHG